MNIRCYPNYTTELCFLELYVLVTQDRKCIPCLGEIRSPYFYNWLDLNEVDSKSNEIMMAYELESNSRLTPIDSHNWDTERFLAKYTRLIEPDSDCFDDNDGVKAIARFHAINKKFITRQEF